MANDNGRYIQVAATPGTKKQIQKMATEHGRSTAAQAGLLLELGIDEFIRREEMRARILAGNTQVDPSVMAPVMTLDEQIERAR